ncbi:MAG: glycosyltransferase [Methanosarcinaceae archaeon]|nr:glycosyltransferase [Methanosarcinaceae archaeon]
MRIAIFHDFIGAIGGGEKLVLTLARGLDADVITTDLDRDAVQKMGYDDVRIISIGKTSKMPGIKQTSTMLKFATCDFSDQYDLYIVSGNWALFAGRKHRPNLFYCHTPARMFYDLYDFFKQKYSFLGSVPFVLWVKTHRILCEWSLSHIDMIVTNSMNTRKRIQRYFHRDPLVIYPPVDTSKYRFKESGDFWLSVNRLYPEKRVDMQIEAFRKMPDEKLVIVGGYMDAYNASEYERTLMADLPDNVKMLGSIPEEELIELYATCRGHLTTPMDEDFGMTAIEAMAAGKPVVAVAEGGYLESVMDGMTGVLVEPNVKSIRNAVKDVSHNPDRFKEACMKRAMEFDSQTFIRKMREEIQRITRSQRG